MLLIPCPHCGPRPELEFVYGGEAHRARPADPAALSDEAWAAFLHERTNPKGRHRERWRHLHGCGQFFNVLRDTRNDAILAAYPIGAPLPEAEEKGSKGDVI
jgi:sarcosine oxidase subunit delta